MFTRFLCIFLSHIINVRKLSLIYVTYIRIYVYMCIYIYFFLAQKETNKHILGSFLQLSRLKIWHCHYCTFGSIPGLQTSSFCGCSNKNVFLIHIWHVFFMLSSSKEPWSLTSAFGKDYVRSSGGLQRRGITYKSGHPGRCLHLSEPSLQVGRSAISHIYLAHMNTPTYIDPLYKEAMILMVLASAFPVF